MKRGLWLLSGIFVFALGYLPPFSEWLIDHPAVLPYWVTTALAYVLFAVLKAVLS